MFYEPFCGDNDDGAYRDRLTDRNAGWRFRFPSESQFSFLEKHGLLPKRGGLTLTRGKASDMIAEFIAKQKQAALAPVFTPPSMLKPLPPVEKPPAPSPEELKRLEQEEEERRKRVLASAPSAIRGARAKAEALERKRRYERDWELYAVE